MPAFPRLHLRRLGVWPLVIGTLFSTEANAQAITSAVDTIYKENLRSGPLFIESVYHLRADGVARLLLSWSVEPSTSSERTYRASEELSYIYTPPTAENPTVATLEFAGGSAESNGVRTLQFYDEDAKDGLISANAVFSFATRTELNGALNVSNRFWIHPGEVAITGFVVDRPRIVLVRGVGPGLAGLGVPAFASDPSLTLYSGPNIVGANDQWGVEGPDAQAMQWIFELVGAFPLAAGSTDAAWLEFVGDGAHTVHVRGAAGSPPGEALAEVYVLPYE